MSVSAQLAKDAELKKGDFFTIKRWTSHKDNSYLGDCFEVKAIDHPYVRALKHDGAFKGKTMTLSLDRVEIMPLSKEFVDDVMGSKTTQN